MQKPAIPLVSGWVFSPSWFKLLKAGLLAMVGAGVDPKGSLMGIGMASFTLIRNAAAIVPATWRRWYALARSNLMSMVQMCECSHHR